MLKQILTSLGVFFVIRAVASTAAGSVKNNIAYTIKNVKLEKLDILEGARFRLSVLVRNANSFPIKLDGFEGLITVANISSKVDLREALLIKTNEEQIINFSLTVQSERFLEELLRLLDGNFQNQIEIDGLASFIVQDQVVEIPINQKFSIFGG